MERTSKAKAKATRSDDQFSDLDVDFEFWTDGTEKSIYFANEGALVIIKSYKSSETFSPKISR